MRNQLQSFVCSRLAWLIVLLLCTLWSTPLQAQDAEPWQKLYGAWNISYDDQKNGEVKGYAVITSPGRMVGKIFYPTGEKGFTCDGLKLEGSKLTGSYWPYFEGISFELQLSADSNTLAGQWSERSASDREPWREGQREYDNPEKPLWYTAKGRGTWTRAVPQIERITVVPLTDGALDFTRLQEDWKYAVVNDNLPKIAIEVKGQNLPVNLYKFQEYFDLKFDDPKLRFHTFEQRPEENAVRLLFWLAKDTSPGRKSFTLNGAQAQFDLRFENYTGANSDPVSESPRVEAVRFVRQATDGFIAIQELAFDIPFLVEVRFTERPDQQQREVTLEWPGQPTRTVTVLRSKDDPKIYRSKPLKMAKPGS